MTLHRLTEDQPWHAVGEPSMFASMPEALVGLRPFLAKHPAGKTVLCEGEDCDSVLVVFNGWLKTVKSLEDGEAQIIDFALPGDILEPVSGDGLTSDVSLEAITDTTVAFVPLARWQALRQSLPDLERFAQRSSGAAHARYAERMLRLGKGTAAMRVTYALLELCIRLKAIGKAQECAYHLPLTQKDIGDFTGLSSVHVCRTLRHLVHDDVITSEDHIDIRILDVDVLSDLAGIDPAELSREIVPSLA